MLARTLAIAAVVLAMMAMDGPAASAQKVAKSSKATKPSPRQRSLDSRKSSQLIRSKGKGSRALPRDRRGRQVNRLGSSRGADRGRARPESRTRSARTSRAPQKSAFRRGPSLRQRPGQSGLFKQSVMRLRKTGR